MSEKEATVYIVDVARSMGKSHNGRDKSDLEWSLEWVYDKITNVVFTGRKTLQVGVVALGTDDTDNAMGDDQSYKHISAVQPIAQILLPELQNLPKVLKPSHTDDRDVVSATIIAVDMIMQHCKHLKYKKKIVVVTNAIGGHIDEDDIEAVAAQCKDHDIELVILGVDFDDAEYGFKEEDKPEIKKKNEGVLKKLIDLSGGQFGTMQEAIDELSRPNVKPVRPTPTYRGQLRLGDSVHYDTALSIDVERYFKVFVRKPPTASAYVINPGGAAGDDHDNLSSVHNLYKYKVKGDEYEGGAKVLDRDELAKGYEYGRTAVSIAESEQNITKYETELAYDILGFIPAENVERYMLMDNANMVVAQKGNDKAAMALSSLIHSLYELGSVAIGRLVKKDMAEPVLTVLSPLAEADFECLVENVLPFAEDMRSYRFPPLDKVLTVSGKALTEHRNLPSEKLLDSMNDFVDNMILTGDDGDEEMIPIDDTFSPLLHTIEGAIKHRAVHANDPNPEERDALKKADWLAYLRQPPPELQERAKATLDKLMKAAEVKKVDPLKAGRRYRNRETEKPLSGLDVSELLGKKHIDPNNAIPEFKQFINDLGAPGDLDRIPDVVKQMQDILENLVRKSFGTKNYPRAIELLGTIREGMFDMETPIYYNDVLRQLKEKLLGGRLGENRGELWSEIRKPKSGLGLITREEIEAADIGKDEVEEFMRFPKAK